MDSDHLSVVRRSIDVDGQGVGLREGCCETKRVTHCDQSLAQYAAVLFTE